MFAVLKTAPCQADDLTVRHLELKLKRFVRRTQRANATHTDYLTRDRLATQLAEARTYLCH